MQSLSSSAVPVIAELRSLPRTDLGTNPSTLMPGLMLLTFSDSRVEDD